MGFRIDRKELGNILCSTLKKYSQTGNSQEASFQGSSINTCTEGTSMLTVHCKIFNTCSWPVSASCWISCSTLISYSPWISCALIGCCAWVSRAMIGWSTMRCRGKGVYCWSISSICWCCWWTGDTVGSFCCSHSSFQTSLKYFYIIVFFIITTSKNHSYNFNILNLTVFWIEYNMWLKGVTMMVTLDNPHILFYC